ncbi:putative transcription factor cys6 protein [Botrytis fragariae]|uniref:Putative transcription factor cys6 protein n=1 Tax=Botrytis fragariae TaxID=1964551 RepID=A0A8H6ARU9_9HELO|nr:putative transcription factor cys6 protein [Botrytis fragariae]KAF5872255.1 putative transcription factor cys6 protein [Botrytis fragariae]
MAMPVFPLDVTPITKNLSVSALEVQPLIGNSASDKNLRDSIKSPIMTPTTEELASHTSTMESSLSTITTVSKAQQNASSDSIITMPLQEQIAKALLLPRLRRHHAMPAYFSAKGNLNSKLSHLRTRRCTQCERHRLQCVKGNADLACKSCKDAGKKCVFNTRFLKADRLLNFKTSDKNNISERPLYQPSEQPNTELSQNRGSIALEHSSIYERQSTDDTIHLNLNPANPLALSTDTTVCEQRQREALDSNSIESIYFERENDAPPNTFVRQSCDIDNIRSRLGRESVDDDQITSPLAYLETLMLQYTELVKGSSMAPLARAKNFWELLCIEDEKVPASNAGTTLANIRGLLDVPTGVLIRQKVDYPLLKTHLKPLDFLRGVIAYIICDFTFQGNSAFGDNAILRKTAYLCFSEHVADIFLQEYHRQMAETQPFEDRMKLRRTSMSEKMNMIMQPLIGAGDNMNNFHGCMAKVCNELHNIVGSYKGEFESIWAPPDSKFDSSIHALDDSQLHPNFIIEGGDILITTCFGVRYKAPGKDWRVCAPAKVILAPPTMVRSTTKRGQEDDLPTTRKSRK